MQLTFLTLGGPGNRRSNDGTSPGRRCRARQGVPFCKKPEWRTLARPPSARTPSASLPVTAERVAPCSPRVFHGLRKAPFFGVKQPVCPVFLLAGHHLGAWSASPAAPFPLEKRRGSGDRREWAQVRCNKTAGRSPPHMKIHLCPFQSPPGALPFVRQGIPRRPQPPAAVNARSSCTRDKTACRTPRPWRTSCAAARRG